MLRNKIKKYYASQSLSDNQKRILAANISASYSEQGSVGHITPTHSKKSENSKPVYAKGPGMWGIGAAAAAVAIAAGATFFGGLDLLPIGHSPAATNLSQPADDGIGYFNMTIDGVKRTGANNNEINVKSLQDIGGDLTVKLEFPDMHIGEENNIKSASYCVFMDGYDTVDVSNINIEEWDIEFNSAGGLFQYYYDDLTDTDDGLYAEYTFSSYDNRNDELSFSIVAIAIFEDYDGNYSMMVDSVYNTAYSDREKVSYLKQFSPDPYPLNNHMYEYYASNVMNGVIYCDKYEENTLNIIGDPGDNLYVEFFAQNNSNPEYAYENAYYLMTFVDGVLLPQSENITPESYYYDGLTMMDCLQCDGTPIAFEAPLWVNELNEVHDVRVIAIPARPYGNNKVMTDSLHYGEDDPVHRRLMEMTIEGYERTGEYSNEINVLDLNGGEDIKVKIRLGNSAGKYDNIDIMGGTYNIFLDGYSALDMTADEASDAGYMQFISKSGSGEFTKTEDGWFAEYTFSFDDLNEISRQGKTFNIVVIADVDLDDDRSSDVTLTDAVYNVAYKEQNKISYLEELYADASPSAHGIARFVQHYDYLLKKAGYYQAPSDPDFHNLLRAGTDIIENKEDGKVYISFYKPSTKSEYLFENAYYIFTFVNDELVPLTDDGELFTLVDCTDCDGNDRFLCAELGNISDLRGVTVVVVPATSYNGNYGAYMGRAIGVDANPDGIDTTMPL